MKEARADGFEADVLGLQLADTAGGGPAGGAAAAVTRAQPAPAAAITVTAPAGRRTKKTVVAVRHATGDRAVAFVELVSPGNKSSRDAFREFTGKAVTLVRREVHLLLIDPLPPGPRDPRGFHPPVWWRLRGGPTRLPADKPLTFAAYEAGRTATRGFLERLAVGDPVPDMPVFLEPGVFVTVPLRDTYEAAFAAVPARWREVVATAG